VLQRDPVQHVVHLEDSSGHSSLHSVGATQPLVIEVVSLVLTTDWHICTRDRDVSTKWHKSSKHKRQYMI